MKMGKWSRENWVPKKPDKPGFVVENHLSGAVIADSLERT